MKQKQKRTALSVSSLLFTSFGYFIHALRVGAVSCGDLSPGKTSSGFSITESLGVSPASPGSKPASCRVTGASWLLFLSSDMLLTP
jgi:hypothetical protein